MADASLRLERYAAVAALPACALGSAVSADIIYTELNTSIYNDSTTLVMAGATVAIYAINYNFTYSSWPVFGLNYMDAFMAGGGIALNGASSAFGNYPGAQGFAAGDEIGAGANFGGSFSFANLVNSYQYLKDDYITAASGGDWFAGYGGQSRLFLGVEIGNESDVNYGWVDISWSAAGGAVIHGYAYESDVNTAIVAGATESAAVVPGAPTAVGLIGLAAGAAGIRRKRSA